MKRTTIQQIISNHGGKPGATLSILMDVQAIQGYLSQEVLQVVAEETRTSLVDIYGIVSSHHHFKLGPRKPGNGEDSEGKSDRESRPDVRCPRCNHSLLDTRWLVDGLPSIRVTAAFGLEHGWFRLSSRPDECSFISEHEFPVKGEANFFCPHCHTQLFSSANCPECDAPKIPMLSRDAGLIPVCSSPHDRCLQSVRGKPRIADRHDRESDEPVHAVETAVYLDAERGS